MVLLHGLAYLSQLIVIFFVLSLHLCIASLTTPINCPMELKLCPATKLSPEVCAQLAQLGCRLSPEVQIARNLMYNGPVFFFPHNNLIRLKIDAYSCINNHGLIVTSSIGRYCSLGHCVEMGLGIHNFEGVTTSPAVHLNNMFMPYSGMINHVPKWKAQSGEETCEVKIGHDVWIGAHVLIPKSVIIGHGAVIGAGSIITHDVPPYAVVAGSGSGLGPGAARELAALRTAVFGKEQSDAGSGGKGIILKYRFPDEVISDLLDLQWWNYDLPKAIASGIKIPMENIHDFIAFMRDYDLSTLPRIEDKWRYVVPESSTKVQVVKVPENFNMGSLFKGPSFPDSYYQSQPKPAAENSGMQQSSYSIHYSVSSS